MTIQYNLSEIRVLASVLASFFSSEQSYWINIVDSFIKEARERSQHSDLIYELIGPYSFGYNKAGCERKGILKLIFQTPIDQMPLYISSDKPWEKVISQWRLSINK